MRSKVRGTGSALLTFFSKKLPVSYGAIFKTDSYNSS